jgi:hypothetical protein
MGCQPSMGSDQLAMPVRAANDSDVSNGWYALIVPIMGGLSMLTGCFNHLIHQQKWGKQSWKALSTV